MDKKIEPLSLKNTLEYPRIRSYLRHDESCLRLFDDMMKLCDNKINSKQVDTHIEIEVEVSETMSSPDLSDHSSDEDFE
jgi:hypothetical protein